MSFESFLDRRSDCLPSPMKLKFNEGKPSTRPQRSRLVFKFKTPSPSLYCHTSGVSVK